MAQGTRKAKSPASSRQAQSPGIQVAVPIPQNTSITVSDLKRLNDKDLSDLLEKVKAAKVGFVILNAPFKVRPVEPVS